MPIKININPLHLSTVDLGLAEKKALHDFLKRKQIDSMWIKNKEYQYTTDTGINYVFCFSKSLLRRQRSKNRVGERFEIVDLSNEPLGQGGYSLVYPILGTIRFEIDDPILKTNKKRIVKIEQHHERDRSHLVLQEYNNLVHVGHLGVKPPVFIHHNGKKSLLVMKQAEGIPLEVLLNPNKREKLDVFIPPLSVEQRLEVTLAILDAVRKQVIDKNLIHRDLKPANMLIDLSQTSVLTVDTEGTIKVDNPSKITIIDYGNAIRGMRTENYRVGTTAYRPPELYLTIPSYTHKSDAYAVGRILSYLWGDNYKNYYLDNKSSWNDIKRSSTNNALFSDPHLALFQKDEQHIKRCLNGLLKEEVGERWSVEEARRFFLKMGVQKYQLNNVRCLSKTELKQYENKIEQQIRSIFSHIQLLNKKGNGLIDRGFAAEGKIALDLANKLQQYTQLLAEDPDPMRFALYRRKCLKKIEESRAPLKNHRDSRWIIAEVITAISLLGVGYLFAVGVNYQCTGRLGLFSQTQSDKAVETIRNSIVQLS